MTDLQELRKCGVCKIPYPEEHFYRADSKLCLDCDMREVTVEQIKHFEICPLYYDFEARLGIPPTKNTRQVSSERFADILTRVAYFFFYKKQSGTTPSYNAISNRWARLWFPKDMDDYDLLLQRFPVTHGNLASLSTIAVTGLLKLYEDFNDITIDPILIAEDVSVPLVDRVTLNDRIDLVYRQGDEYSVVKFSCSRKRPKISDLELDFAALKYAFNHRNLDAPKRAKYYIYDLASSKPGLVEYSVDYSSIDKLKFLAEEIRDTHNPYPRRGQTALCRGCTYDKECMNWNNWKGKK